MSRIIDAEWLLDVVENIIEWDTERDRNRIIHQVRELTPTADVRENVKGEWIEKEVITEKVIDEWQSACCSKCGKYHTTPYMYYFSNYNYCPNCGADMRGDKDERMDV